MRKINSCLVLTHNNLYLSKLCVDSLLQQDIPTRVWIVDNGSTDGTAEHFKSSEKPNEMGISYHRCIAGSENLGVSKGWNIGLSNIFAWPRPEVQTVLVVGSDTILAPWTYSALLSANKPFVTGVDVGMDALPEKPDVFPLSPHPDFSCFLIRRECWEAVGPFDERMTSYASDCAYHVEAHRKGIPLYKASVPYNHLRSSTLNRAPVKERQQLQEQAHRDRQVFRELYGCLPGTPEYTRLFE